MFRVASRSRRAAVGRLRAVPLAVWLIVMLHFVVTLLQTAVFPNTRSPDELQHVDLIVQVHEGTAWPWPGPGEAAVTQGTSAGRFMQIDRLPGRRHLAQREGMLPPRDQRQTYHEAGGTAPMLMRAGDGDPQPRLNQLVQHPPLYYVLGAGFLHLLPNWESQPFDRVWLLLRWWNALLTAPLPLLLWAAARRLALPRPLPAAAALVPLAIPEMTHLDSAVNNDNLLITLAAVATYFVARVLTGDLSRRTGMALGTLITAMLLTKGFALLVPAFVGLAYVVAGRRHRRYRKALVALLIAAATSVPGALWWGRNLLVHGRFQPAGNATEQPALTPVYGWEDGGSQWLERYADRMVTLFFVQDHAALERHDASWWMSRVGLSLIVLGIVVTLLRRTLPRLDVLVLILPVIALAAIVAKGSWEQFAAYQNLAGGQQGRYLYSGMPGLAVVTVAGAAALRPAIRRFVPLALVALVAVMHAAYQYDVWWLYWVPSDGTRTEMLWRSVEAMAYWFPFPPWVLVVLGGAGTLLAVAILVVLVRLARDLSPYTAGSRPVELMPDGGRA